MTNKLIIYAALLLLVSCRKDRPTPTAIAAGPGSEQYSRLEDFYEAHRPATQNYIINAAAGARSILRKGRQSQFLPERSLQSMVARLAARSILNS